MASSTHRVGPNFRDVIVKGASMRLSDATARTTTDYAEIICGDGAPSGAYGRHSGATMLYARKDASSVDAAWYITVNGGTAWTPIQTSGAGGTQADLIFDAATELTIATGAITATQGYHTIDTEADAASDDLDTIAGGTAGEVVIVRAADAARTVVLKHAVGANRIACIGARDISLAEANDTAILVYNGTQWVAFGSTLLDNILGTANTWTAAQALLDTTTLEDPADRTKKVRIDAGTVSAGQTRVLTMPDSDVTLVASPASLAAAAPFTDTVTTTDGVASGTARRIGGVASRIVADGTAHTSSTDEAVLASYEIPANTLKAGTVVKVRWSARVTADNAGTTLTGRLRLGATTLTGTELVVTSAVDTSANHLFVGEYLIQAREAPGAASAVVGVGMHALGAAGSNMVSAGLATTALATNGALKLEVTGDWSAADANSVRAEVFVVEVVG